MEFLTKSIKCLGGCLTIEVPRNLLPSVDALVGATRGGKELRVQVIVNRKKRSLDANAALWGLLGKMAEALHTSAEEIYLKMLERYGVSNFYIVRPEAVERVKREWRLVKEIGPVKCNGKEGIQLQCFYGSHNYDTKEMSRLIDGTIYEAKNMGIEYISKADRDLYLSEWGRGHDT